MISSIRKLTLSTTLGGLRGSMRSHPVDSQVLLPNTTPTVLLRKSKDPTDAEPAAPVGFLCLLHLYFFNFWVDIYVGIDEYTLYPFDWTFETSIWTLVEVDRSLKTELELGVH
jgi:hypothetical protein